MAQVTNDYQIPSGIRWDYDGDIGTGGWFSTHADVSETRGTLYITWQSPYYTFQAQWRRRRRLSPAKSLTVAPSGATVWEEWGEWEGSNLSEDAAIGVTRQSEAARYLAAPFSIPYDFSEYDLHEYQVRVRVLDEPSLTCSEWAYETLRVAFRPKWEYGSAVRNADGSVTLDVLHNMPRACRFRLGSLEVAGSNGMPRKIGAMNQRLPIPAGGGSISIPTGVIGSHETVETPTADLTTYDNVSQGGAGTGFTVGQAAEDDAVAEPCVSIEETESRINVNVEDAGYDKVFVSAEWVDAYNAEHVEELSVLDFRGDNALNCWRGIFEAPPYGVEVTYRVSVVGEGGWRFAYAIRETENKGVISLTSAEEDICIELMYDSALKSDSAIEGELVKCAGRSKPVARHGNGATTKITANGTILAKGGGAWLPEVQMLKEGRAWIYRNPLGERMNVMVESVSVSFSHGDFAELSISMTEVE